MTHTFHHIVAGMARHLGLQEPDGVDRAWDLTVDGIKVVLEPDRDAFGEGLLLRASLGTVPQAGRDTVLRAVLEGNLLWSGTGGATIGVNSATGEAVIALSRPLEALDGERAARLCLGFADVAARWRNLLAAGITNTSEEPPPDAMLPGLMRV